MWKQKIVLLFALRDLDQKFEREFFEEHDSNPKLAGAIERPCQLLDYPFLMEILSTADRPRAR